MDSFPEAAEALGDRRLAHAVWAFLLLGLVVRAIRYLLRVPLWPDEGYLVYNFLDRGYLDLLKPLDFIQIAPVLYLWVQATIVRLLGFSEYTLRLYVFLCSVGSLFLFRHLAGRLLRGTSLLLAVGIFSVAYPLVRYSAEAKPYGSDMFVSLVLLTLTVEWCRRPHLRRWWLALTCALPIAILLSYPAVFVAGGVSITMAVVLWRQGTWRDWLRWGISNAALCAAFAAVFALSARGQMAASGANQRKSFAEAFPPLHSPLQLIKFLIYSNTSETMAFPVGTDRGGSSLTTLCCAVGLVLLIRARRFSLATLFTVPMALHFAAAAIHWYPYGNHVRFALYTAPIICLLAGLGAAWILAAVRIRRRPALEPVVVLSALFVLIAVSTSVRDLMKPYKETCWMRNRDFARWFWTDKARDAELVCVERDLGQHFYSDAEDDSLSCIYFCNQRIYSARHAAGESPQLDRVSAAWPLRCAHFRSPGLTPHGKAALDKWLAEMQSRYRLVSLEKYPLTFWVGERELRSVARVELYEFVPKDSATERP